MASLLKKVINTKTVTIIISLLLMVMVCLWWYSRPSRATIAAAEVATIAKDIQKLYAQKASYWMLNTESLKSNDILTEYRYKNKQLINALGKPILIGKGENGDIVMPGEKSFDVVYTDLSMVECVNVASYQFKQQETLGLLQITIVGPEKSRTFEWSATDYALPISRPEAKIFCGNASKVIWTFE